MCVCLGRVLGVEVEGGRKESGIGVRYKNVWCSNGGAAEWGTDAVHARGGRDEVCASKVHGWYREGGDGDHIHALRIGTYIKWRQ